MDFPYPNDSTHQIIKGSLEYIKTKDPNLLPRLVYLWGQINGFLFNPFTLEIKGGKAMVVRNNLSDKCLCYHCQFPFLWREDVTSFHMNDPYIQEDFLMHPHCYLEREPPKRYEYKDFGVNSNLANQSAYFKLLHYLAQGYLDEYDIHNLMYGMADHSHGLGIFLLYHLGARDLDVPLQTVFFKGDLWICRTLIDLGATNLREWSISDSVTDPTQCWLNIREYLGKRRDQTKEVLKGGILNGDIINIVLKFCYSL